MLAAFLLLDLAMVSVASRFRAVRFPARALGFLLLGVVALPPVARAATIDFTRYLYRSAVGMPSGASVADRFVATPGRARLIVEAPPDALITLNGLVVNEHAQTDGAGPAEFAVTLQERNAISVSFKREAADSVSVRVKQQADVELHVMSRVHFNTNVSDFESARAFYGKLGFETLSGFPDTNTQAMARAIGVKTPTTYDGSQGGEAGGYLLHGELIGLGFMSGVIDLIEFTTPRNESPPYARLNHLGMARAVLHTSNIEADYEYMRAQGVEFIAAPTARSDGSGFAIFTDLDGTYYELREVAAADEDTETTHIVGFGPLNINVSDFERSAAWYRMLGHEITEALPTSQPLAVARAMGFDEEFEIEGAIATLPADGSTIELRQWKKPYDPERAYGVPVNHLGIHRTAFATSDIEADVATLKAQGVVFVSEITPCCSGPDASGRIVAFYDPDGTIVELVEQPLMNWIIPLLLWARDTFS